MAIIVPHSDFLGKLKPLLKKKLQEEITCRKLSKRLGLISFEDSLSYLVSSSVAEQDSKEEHMILDSIDNAKGLEQLIVIVVGMDAEIKSKGARDRETVKFVGRSRVENSHHESSLMPSSPVDSSPAMQLYDIFV